MKNALNMTWVKFNERLMKLTNEDDVQKLLRGEQKGQRRLAYLMRLYSRFNKLRSRREKGELLLPIRGRRN